MKDGSMLDFSGRHQATGYKAGKPKVGQPDYLKGQRNVDHREIANIFDEAIDGTDAMLAFETEGNIRVSPSGKDLNVSLNLDQKLTPKQIGSLENMHKQLGGDVYYDIYKAGGTDAPITSGKTTSVTKVLKDFFKQGGQQVKVAKVKATGFDDPTVEMVKTKDVARYREFTRPKDARYKKLEANIKKNGIKEPIIIDYYMDGKTAIVGEGNRRLQIAQELGIKEIPARVMRNIGKATFQDTQTIGVSKYPAQKVPGVKPDASGYVPGNMKPSEIGIGVAPKVSKKLQKFQDIEGVKTKPAMDKVFDEIDRKLDGDDMIKLGRIREGEPRASGAKTYHVNSPDEWINKQVYYNKVSASIKAKQIMKADFLEGFKKPFPRATVRDVLAKDVVVYRASSRTEFGTAKDDKGWLRGKGTGMYTTPQRDYAKKYATGNEKIVKTKIPKDTKVLELDDIETAHTRLYGKGVPAPKDGLHGTWIDNLRKAETRIARKALSLGYDVLHFKNELYDFGYGQEVGKPAESYVILKNIFKPKTVL